MLEEARKASANLRPAAFQSGGQGAAFGQKGNDIKSDAEVALHNDALHQRQPGHAVCHLPFLRRPRRAPVRRQNDSPVPRDPHLKWHQSIACLQQLQ